MDFDYRYGSSTLFPLLSGILVTVQYLLYGVLFIYWLSQTLAFSRFGRGQNPRRSFILGKTTKKNEFFLITIFYSKD